MAEAKCIARLVHLVDHDHTELVNMDDFSLHIYDQLNCQLLVNLADHGSPIGPGLFEPTADPGVCRTPPFGPFRREN